MQSYRHRPTGVWSSLEGHALEQPLFDHMCLSVELRSDNTRRHISLSQDPALILKLSTRRRKSFKAAGLASSEA